MNNGISGSVRALMDIAPRPDTVFVKGQGDWLYDLDGARYLDWVQGWAVNCLGHSHPAIVETLVSQAHQLINCSPAFYNKPMVDLAWRLTSSSCADQVFFANSGAEANEGAIKLARKWGQLHKGGAHEIITFENSFHGRTLATMAATGKEAWQSLFAPAVPGFVKARYNDIDSVRPLISNNTAAIMLEPVQGEGGVIPAEPEFVQALAELAGENNVLLIFDEVQTGVGRTGHLFGYQYYDVEPDIFTLGKGLGGGVPIAALMAQKRVCCFEYGDQGGTFNGNPLVTAIADKVVSIVQEEGFAADVRAKSDLLKVQLSELVQRYPDCSVRGRGMLLAVVLPKPVAKSIVAEAFKERFMINAPRENVLRFMPALTISEEAIDSGVKIIDKLLAAHL